MVMVCVLLFLLTLVWYLFVLQAYMPVFLRGAAFWKHRDDGTWYHFYIFVFAVLLSTFCFCYRDRGGGTWYMVHCSFSIRTWRRLVVFVGWYDIV